MKTPVHTWPVYDEDEIQAATDVLRSGKVNYWTGNECKAFETEFAEYMGSKYAIALANGTLALELALLVLDIGPGDEVIVPSRTFMASASCIVARGAAPIVADIDPVSQNITVETIKAALTAKTKAIIVVHLAGWPCEMDKIMDFAKANHLYVIEDCAQAHGAKYKSKYVGSWGDVAAFSFCQDKIMTTGGEGGILLLNNEAWWKKAWAYKDHGKGYDVTHAQHPPGFRWLHESFGSNWRLTEMQAAIGRIQLRKLESWIKHRTKVAKAYNQVFAQFKCVRINEPCAEIVHAYYRYYIFIKPDYLKPGWSRDRIMQAVTAKGIICLVGSCSEIYLEKAFELAGLQPKARLPVAKALGETSLALLLHPTLSDSDVQQIVAAVQQILSEASL